jgi:hypothetical protein
MTLADIIAQIRSGAGTRDEWLYISGDAVNLSLDSEAEFSEIEIDEENDCEEIVPPEYSERGLHSTIDYQTVEDCIRWSDRLTGKADDIAACKIIRYYLRFDAWPNSLDAPDPLLNMRLLQGLIDSFMTSLGRRDLAQSARETDA